MQGARSLHRCFCQRACCDRSEQGFSIYRSLLVTLVAFSVHRITPLPFAPQHNVHILGGIKGTGTQTSLNVASPNRATLNIGTLRATVRWATHKAANTKSRLISMRHLRNDTRLRPHCKRTVSAPWGKTVTWAKDSPAPNYRMLIPTDTATS